MFVFFVMFCTSALFSQTIASVNMLLFWGYPASSIKFCEPQSTIIHFDSCINLCLKETYCMLAFGNDSSCTLCDIYAVSKITQSNYTSNIQTAIKIDSQLQCPKNMTTNQYTYTTGSNNYKLTFSDPSWTITYEKSCVNSTFRMFPRPTGPFCLDVLWSVGNRVKSSTYCKDLGEGLDLAGMQTKKEFDYVLKTAKTKSYYNTNYKYSTVWLSGIMRSACQTSPVPSGCDGIKAFSGFSYQDNFDVYKFAPGYPKIPSSASPRSMQLLISQSESAFEGMIGDALSDYICDGQSPPVICVFYMRRSCCMKIQTIQKKSIHS